jgi:hypothetical protein
MLSAATQSTISPWNSLEVAKLLVSVLTPIVVVAVGFWINRRLKGMEHLQWSNQKIIEKRIAIYDAIAPLLNDLMCYFTYIGCWKDLSPVEVVALKRHLDKIAYVNAPLLPPSFLQKYNALMESCYQTYSGWGNDAKLRTQYERRRQAADSKWSDEWDCCFADRNFVSEPTEVRRQYTELMTYLASELGINATAGVVRTGRVPANIC